MASQISDSSVPLEVQQQIDACCQAFEDAWKAGGTPQLEEFLDRVPQVGRRQLLRELLILEMNYRRDDRGKPISDSQLCDLHPQLMPDIADCLNKLFDRPAAASNGDAAPTKKPGTVVDFEPTIDHTPQTGGSRGLHIRCPHCSNPVELLSDSPLESITCRTCGSTFSLIDQEDHTREAPVLKKIGRFELVARLGLGGFGTVWKARDTELDRTVAVKIPRKGQLAREEIEQFFREARSAAQLQHPNIVPVHEVGRDGETIFIVSDLIRGVSLSDWLSGATPKPKEIARLLVTISEALHHAHQHGVIHRDLKPSNILMDDNGQPHIMDFGLAKREVGEITMTVEGQVLGTPAYMSPEQAHGQAHWTDRRSDIYSLGVVLFRMLTGELPFRGNAQMQIHQRLTEEPPDPRKLNKYLPKDLCTICLKCLERDPNRRHNSAQDLADELNRFVRNEPILSRPISRVERVLRWAKRNPALATAASLVAFLAVAGPLAAFQIRSQRDALADKVIENNRLISQFKNESRRATGQIEDLTDQLNTWEGRANPWEFWPPKQGTRPRQNMITDAFNESSTALEKPLRSGKFDREKSARGYLGLAAMADVIGQTAEAKEFYEAARDQLLALRREQPQQPHIERALADCYTQLSRLTAEADPDQSASDLKSAHSIYQKLSVQNRSDATHQLDLLESELASATMAGFDSGQDHLARVSAINRALAGNWPSDPDELYRVACYLTEREPILTPATPAGSAKVENPSAVEPAADATP